MKKIVDYPIITLNLDEVYPNKYNPKINFLEDKTNKEIYEKLKKSIQNNGYEDKIKVRKNEEGKYEIVDGYHRYCALKELGFTENIQVIYLGEVTLSEGIAKTLAGEEIKIPLDEIEVAGLLKSLKEDGEIENIKDLLPYTLEEIDLKIEILDFNFEDPEEDSEETEEEVKEIIIKVLAKDEGEAELIKQDLDNLGYKYK